MVVRTVIARPLVRALLILRPILLRLVGRLMAVFSGARRFLRLQGLEAAAQIGVLLDEAIVDSGIFGAGDVGRDLVLKFAAEGAEIGERRPFKPAQRFCGVDVKGAQFGAARGGEEWQFIDGRPLAFRRLAGLEDLVMAMKGLGIGQPVARSLIAGEFLVRRRDEDLLGVADEFDLDHLSVLEDGATLGAGFVGVFDGFEGESDVEMAGVVGRGHGPTFRIENDSFDLMKLGNQKVSSARRLPLRTFYIDVALPGRC
jgi:hypothetical protein